VQRLLRAGLDVNFVDQHGSGALHKAARSGRVEVLVFMVTNCLPNIELQYFIFCIGGAGITRRWVQ
jgi:hypothetical protein